MNIRLRKHKHINVTRKFRLKDIFYHKHLFSFYQSLPTKISARLWEKFEIKFQLLNFLYFQNTTWFLPWDALYKSVLGHCRQRLKVVYNFAKWIQKNNYLSFLEITKPDYMPCGLSIFVNYQKFLTSHIWFS